MTDIPPARTRAKRAWRRCCAYTFVMTALSIQSIAQDSPRKATQKSQATSGEAIKWIECEQGQRSFNLYRPGSSGNDPYRIVIGLNDQSRQVFMPTDPPTTFSERYSASISAGTCGERGSKDEDCTLERDDWKLTYGSEKIVGGGSYRKSKSTESAESMNYVERTVRIDRVRGDVFILEDNHTIYTPRRGAQVSDGQRVVYQGSHCRSMPQVPPAKPKF